MPGLQVSFEYVASGGHRCGGEEFHFDAVGVSQDEAGSVGGEPS